MKKGFSMIVSGALILSNLLTISVQAVELNQPTRNTNTGDSTTELNHLMNPQLSSSTSTNEIVSDNVQSKEEINDTSSQQPPATNSTTSSTTDTTVSTSERTVNKTSESINEGQNPKIDNKKAQSSTTPTASEITITVNKITEWTSPDFTQHRFVNNTTELTGTVGEGYTINSDWQSSKVKRVDGALTGIFSEDKQVNIYYYPTSASVHINYVDSNGGNYRDAGFPNSVNIAYLDDTFKSKSWDAPKNDDGTYTHLHEINNGMIYDIPDYVTVDVMEGNQVVEEIIPASAHIKPDKFFIEGWAETTQFTFGLDSLNAPAKYDLVNSKGRGKRIDVNYHYKQVEEQTEGKANAKFFDMETGEQIASPKTKTGTLGESYDWDKEKEFHGYKLVQTFGYDKGTFTKEDRNVDFLYKKYKKIAVLSLFKDIDTGRKLQDDDGMFGMTVGDSYHMNEIGQLRDPILNSEYEFVKVVTNNDNPLSAVLDEDMVNNGDVEVTYYFKKRTAPLPYLKMTPIRTKFVDLDGKSIAEDVVTSQKLGTDYQTKALDIAGYRLVHTDGNAKGVAGETEVVVTYVYQKETVKSSQVTVKYQDTEGNKLSDDVILLGNVGDSYATEQKKISGYTFKEVKGITDGKFSDKSQVIIFIYTKVTSGGTGDTDTSGTSERGTKPDGSNKIENQSRPTVSNKTKSLPKTGESTQGSFILGLLGGLTVLSVAIIVFRKRFVPKK